jgi:hypothetical protein
MLAHLNTGNPGKYEIAILRSADWVPLRHEVSGVVTGRAQTVDAGARRPDGHCTFQEFELSQDFDGLRFTEPLMTRGIGQQWEVPCATLDAARQAADTPSSDDAKPAAPSAADQYLRCLQGKGLLDRCP